ncbi:hypothetical protein TNIN_160071, partial [Trichonephila inaurata madagascariensis]
IRLRDDDILDEMKRNNAGGANEKDFHLQKAKVKYQHLQLLKPK